MKAAFHAANNELVFILTRKRDLCDDLIASTYYEINQCINQGINDLNGIIEK